MTNSERVFDLIAKIPKGKVSTYGHIAAMANITNPRVVGNILHHNVDPQKYPCHRVVNSTGRLAPAYAFGGEEVQREKLVSEGVIFRGTYVDLQQSLWQPSLNFP